MTQLSPGDTAPAFELTSSSGEKVRLADYAGETVVVYFYPAALTPGCTLEAVDFNKAKEEFAKSGYQIIGISPDSPEKLAKVVSTARLSLILLSDPGRKTLTDYGAWGTKKLYGKEIEGVIRSTLIIDVNDAGVGTVQMAKYNVKATGHVARLLKDLGID